MQPYDTAASRSAQAVINSFSTSFSSASRLFPARIRPHIYHIYGLVRIADEIVDSYRGQDAELLLDALEAETLAAIKRGFSPDMIVHAFAVTAREHGIDPLLIRPFFASMRQDLRDRRFTADSYASYIYGSAEVVGLMCLHVFCADDTPQYRQLQPGAQALGAAFQKINFLRDMASDWQTLGRYYFPMGEFATFDETAKQTVIDDIRHDLQLAQSAIAGLPASVQPAVRAATYYYQALLQKIAATPAELLKQRRVRIANSRKAALFAKAVATPNGRLIWHGKK